MTDQYNPFDHETELVDLRLHSPKPESELVLTRGLSVEFFYKPPNWWWRLWQFLLLGFKWKKL